MQPMQTHTTYTLAGRLAVYLAAAGLAVGTLAACGGAAEDTGASFKDRAPDAGNAGEAPPGASDAGAGGGGGAFVPEEEEFVVRQVAVSDEFVFVPNSDETSTTVARIDGRQLNVTPITVGRQPVQVRATSVEGVGTVAYVLSEGQSVISVVRADRLEPNGGADSPGSNRAVNLLPVPEETNAIALSPDGRHLLAYIDPERPLPKDASVASLQALSLIRLGDSPDQDTVHQLSVTRLIEEIEFTEDASRAFVIGREGVNRLDLAAISSDTFVPPLDLGLSDSAFPPKDREVEVSPDGSFLIVRSSAFAGIALFRPADGTLRMVKLPARPTDIDLHTPEGGDPSAVVSLRSTRQVALVDIETVLNAPPADDDNDGDTSDAGTADTGADTGPDAGPSYQPPEGVTLIDAGEAEPGLAQLTPDETGVLLYTTLVLRPYLGLLDLNAEAVSTWRLRNKIRSVTVGPNSRTAVIVHEKQQGPPASDAGPLEFFQHNHGITLVDLESGYRRPVTLQADPADIVMTSDAGGTPFVFAMLQSNQPDKRGLMRINLDSYRTDFFRLPRQPTQMGVVAGRVFVSQEATEGRITFFDLDSEERQTVSGYELNAGID